MRQKNEFWIKTLTIHPSSLYNSYTKMPIGIKISELEEAALKLLRAFPDQVKYACATTLTRIALDAQQDVRESLSKNFTIRSPWVSKGIRIKPANRGTLISFVYSKDSFMGLQETGGEKKAVMGSRLAVPVGIRKNKKTKTPRRLWPGALIRSNSKTKHVFYRPLKGSRGRAIGLWQRTSGRRGKLKLLYILKKSVQINPSFNFRNTVATTAKRVFPARFYSEVVKAITTRKR